jgi:hypothetical protein
LAGNCILQKSTRTLLRPYSLLLAYPKVCCRLLDTCRERGFFFTLTYCECIARSLLSGIIMAPTANRGHYKSVAVVVSTAFIAETAATLVGVLSIEKPIRRASSKRRRRVPFRQIEGGFVRTCHPSCKAICKRIYALSGGCVRSPRFISAVVAAFLPCCPRAAYNTGVACAHATHACKM